jgi:DNA replication protein DnaC
MNETTTVPARRCRCGAPAATYHAGNHTLHARDCSDCMARRSANDDAAETAAALRARLRAAGLLHPRRAHWSYATVPADLADAARKSRNWADSLLQPEPRTPAGNLLIYGTVGAGKTGLAHATLRHLIEHGTTGLFTNVRDLLADLRASYDHHQPAVYDRALRVSVLCLDDLGAERPTPWAVEQLARLVDHRYDHCLATIITSNYTPDALVGRLAPDNDPIAGQRIISRLTHHTTQIRTDHTDRRRTARIEADRWSA